MDVISAFLASFIAWLIATSSSTLVAHNIFPAPPAHIVVGGDMMFDRSIRTTLEAKGGDYLFSCVEPLLSSADVVVANLEGPITSNPSKSVGSAVGGLNNYTFTFPTTTADLLRRHNIWIVNIGNNHIMNFSRAGLLETKEWLTRAGVTFFGDPDSLENDKVARVSISGIPLSFVNWSDWTSDKTDHTVAQVRAEAQSGRVVIVYTHWGEEYKPATELEKRLAHDFVDAGAAIVIGSHPHVVQEHEIYQGKDIYYSLGNFIFDQYWEEAVRNGLLLDLTISKDGTVGVKEIPIELMRDRRVCPKEVE